MTARIGLFTLAAAAVASLTTASAWAQTNVLYLNSQPGDYIGQGRRVTYTTGSFTELGFSTQIVGFSFYADTDATYWYLDFAAPQGQALGPGMYEGATRYPFQSPTHVGLDVSGDGRACNTLTGRFLVLDASYDVDGSVLTFAADFEQHCEGGTSALYGAIRVNSSLPIVPKLAIGDAAVIENPVGTPMKFTISLSQPAAGPVMVQFATADGTAQAGSDYVATSGTVTFKPAETSRPIAIQTLSDRAAEGDQYFYVNLSGPVGATVADSQGQGTIVDTGGQRVSAADRLYLASEVPTLIVWGERDPMIPVAHGRAAHAAIAGSRLEIFPDSGHFPHRDAPRRFVEVLVDFMQSTAPARVDETRWRTRLRHGA